MSRFSSHDQKQLLFHRSKLGLADFSDIWLILLVPSQGLERRSCCKLARRSKEIKDKKIGPAVSGTHTANQNLSAWVKLVLNKTGSDLSREFTVALCLHSGVVEDPDLLPWSLCHIQSPRVLPRKWLSVGQNPKFMRVGPNVSLPTTRQCFNSASFVIPPPPHPTPKIISGSAFFPVLMMRCMCLFKTAARWK